jgi:capsular polysaccharide export protein
MGKNLTAPLSLRQVQGSKFNVFRQLRNRWEDRNDLERVRLHFLQHANARISYSMYRKRYAKLSDISKPFLFFPLQTHTDSNIAINGDLVPYSLYVEIVISAFKSMRPQLNCDLLIKEHPFDVFRHAYNRASGDGVLWLSPETPVPEIILSGNCLGTVVVNSTAGFESLLLGKPVVTLGRSMFSHKELVEIPLSIDTGNIARSLLNLVGRKVNQHEVREFAAHFFDRTQLIGNLEDSPTKEEIVRFEQLLHKMVNG